MTNHATLDDLHHTIVAVYDLLAARLPKPPDDPQAPVEGFTDTATPLDAYTVGELIDELNYRFFALGDHGVVRIAINSLVKIRASLPDEALHFRTEYK